MKPDRESVEGNIAADVVFSIITCGIYGLFWQNRIFKAANALIGEEKYRFLPWFLFSLITCGIYNIYIQYILGGDLDRGLRKEGAPGNDSLPLLALVLSVVGLHIVATAIEQNELNKLYN